MHHSAFAATRAGFVSLALGCALPLLGAPARAATVFDNYTGNIPEGFGAAYVAAGFTPAANFDFTGEAAFVENTDESSDAPQAFTLSLFSSTAGGSPASALWTSDPLSVSGPFGAGLFAEAVYSGPPIPLQSGVQYFVVLHELGSVAWFVGGSVGVPIYTSADSSDWSGDGAASVQFAVDGDPGTPAVPEASTWAMMLAGFVSLGLAGSHRRRNRAKSAPV